MPVSVNIPFSTTIIIPFNISSNKEEVISENNLKDNVFYEELRQYLFRISTNKHSIIDKLKYHTYISNYLGSNENKDNDLSFLETFFIDPEKVNKIIKDKIPFNFFFNRINLKLGKSNRENLTEEVGDLLCMGDLLIKFGGVDDREVYVARAAKEGKLRKWSNIFKEAQ